MSKEIQYLIHGYEYFRRHYFDGSNMLFSELVRNGQRPKTLIIACSDSRVDPAIVLSCKPGDLFMVRNVANLVPPHQKDNAYHGTSAALEFGICELGIKHIIVFGHTQCGGLKALLKKHMEANGHAHDQKTSYVNKWIELAGNACETVLRDHRKASLDQKTELCCQYSLLDSLKNLSTFPWIKDRVDAGELSMHAWYFDLAHGLIRAHDPITDSFEELKLHRQPYHGAEDKHSHHNGATLY